jgi:hypothetical protein
VKKGILVFLNEAWVPIRIFQSNEVMTDIHLQSPIHASISKVGSPHSVSSSCPKNIQKSWKIGLRQHVSHV